MLTKARIIFAAVVLLLGGAVAAASLGGEPRRELAQIVDQSKKTALSTDQLAHWIISGRRDFVLLDLRHAAAYKAGHIRGAYNCQGCHQDREQGRKYTNASQGLDLAKKIVLYAENDKQAIQLPRAIASRPGLYRLQGGYQSWKASVLGPTPPPRADDSPEQNMARRKHAAVRDWFLGKATRGSGAEQLKIKPVRRMRAHQAAADEGC